jgi:hypothetical protein
MTPARAKSKIPTWVWALTIGGILFIASLYTLIFWGYSKVSDLARDGIRKGNPDFEMLYISNQGKVKVRHKPTGKEFLVAIPPGNSRIPLRSLATKRVASAPAWLQLSDAVPSEKVDGWDFKSGTDILVAELEEVLAGHGFVTESRADSTLTACEAKRIQCVAIGYGSAGSGSWYNASYFETP